MIFGGDLNTDTSRTSPHTRELLQCVVDCCLSMCIEMNESKILYTYIVPNGNSSRIDNFLISDIMSESVIDCSIVDDHLHSHHLPVKLSLDFNITHSAVSKRPHVVKKAWHKANDCHIDMYKSKLNEQLPDSDTIRMQKMAEALVSNKTRDLFSETSKIKGCNNILPSSVDDASTVDDIVNLFADKYSNLYNSVAYDQSEINYIKYIIDAKLQNDVHQNYSVNVHDVVKVINHLKYGTSDEKEGLWSDHLIHGTHNLYVMLTLLFNYDVSTCFWVFWFQYLRIRKSPSVIQIITGPLHLVVFLIKPLIG